VPLKYKEDPKFANWVKTQRTLLKNGIMGQGRKKMLDEIGFDFSCSDKANVEDWNLQLKKLQDYHEEHGHCELFWAVNGCTFI
jgi:hypothetical protein